MGKKEPISLQLSKSNASKEFWSTRKTIKTTLDQVKAGANAGLDLDVIMQSIAKNAAFVKAAGGQESFNKITSKL